ncbi:hypothetical protein PWR05_35280 [Paraburkholderia sp. A2RI-6]|uniref:hypothetical protein n=1 Tax=Paraburkholderia sp. A2RI-6 TaxID=3028371 RepID=UPI003B817156
MRLAINQSPKRWQQFASAEPSFSPEDKPARESEAPTVLRTGERSPFLNFVEILRTRIADPSNLENLANLLSHVKTLTLPADTLYAGTLGANPFGAFSRPREASKELAGRAMADLGFSQISGAT